MIFWYRHIYNLVFFNVFVWSLYNHTALLVGVKTLYQGCKNPVAHSRRAIKNLECAIIFHVLYLMHTHALLLKLTETFAPLRYTIQKCNRPVPVNDSFVRIRPWPRRGERTNSAGIELFFPEMMRLDLLSSILFEASWHAWTLKRPCRARAQSLAFKPHCKINLSVQTIRTSGRRNWLFSVFLRITPEYKMLLKCTWSQ